MTNRKSEKGAASEICSLPALVRRSPPSGEGGCGGGLGRGVATSTELAIPPPLALERELRSPRTPQGGGEHQRARSLHLVLRRCDQPLPERAQLRRFGHPFRRYQVEAGVRRQRDL